ITAVDDDPPINTVPGAQTVDEDTALAFNSGNSNLISVTDPDGNLSSTQLQVNNGSLTVSLSGLATISSGVNGSGSLTISGTETDINATLATLVYQGTLNFNGSDTLTVTSTDATARTDIDTVGITITAVDDDPPINTVPGAQTVDEDTALAFNSGNSNLISVTDPDGNLSSTQLQVNNGSLTVSLSGLATINAGANGSSSLTISGTETDINATLATLVYQGNLNFNGSDTLTVTSTDATARTDIDTVDITITAVDDDPPINTVPGAQTVDEDTALAFNSGNSNLISVTDADGNLSSTQLQVNNGSLTVSLSGLATINAGANGSGSLTISGTETDINATLATLVYQGNLNFNGSDTLTVTSTDATARTDIDTVDITVTGIGDPPINTVPGAQTVDEDTALAFNSGNSNLISVTDADGNLSSTQLQVNNGSLTVSLSGLATISSGANGSGDLTISGTETDINATLATLVYQGNLNFNGSDTLTVTSTDATARTDIDTVDITITAVDDDPPINTVPGAQTVDEDTALAFNSGNSNLISVTDPDGNLSSTQLQVNNGSLTVSLSGLAIISSGANGSGSLTISGTETDINETLATLVYQGNLNFNGSDTLTVTSTDATARTDIDTVDITVTGIGDPPINTVPGAQTVDEDTALAFNSGNSNLISVTDPDGNLSSTQLQVNNGSLTVSLSGLATINAGANGSSSLTISGTETDINATLATLVYQGNLNFNGSDTLTVTSTDATARTDIDTVDITITSVDDDPPINTVPGAQTVDEDTALAFNSGNSNLISVTDPDGNLSSTQLQVNNGSLTVSLSGLATISSGANGSSSLTISGTEADINATLATLVYQGNLNFNGSDILTVTSTDATARTDIDTVDITVAVVSDPPTGQDIEITIPHNQAYVLKEADFGFADTVEGNAFVSVEIGTLTGSGSYRLLTDAGDTTSGSVISTGDTISITDINDNKLVFIPVLNTSGDDYSVFNFKVTDDGGTANGGSDTAVDFNTITFNVAEISITAVDAAASEDPLDDGSFTVSLGATNDTGNTVRVHFEVNGQAEALDLGLGNPDYDIDSNTATYNGTNTYYVDIANGSLSQVVNVNVINDSVFEGNEDIDITLTNIEYLGATPDPDAFVLSSDSNELETEIIIDDDEDNSAPIVVEINADDDNEASEDGDTARFEVDLGVVNHTNSDIIITYSISGSATSGTSGAYDYSLADMNDPISGDNVSDFSVDYGALTGTITIKEGYQYGYISVENIHDDILFEGDETVELTLTSVNNSSLFTTDTNSAIVTIEDNEASDIVSVSAINDPVNESGGSGIFRIDLGAINQSSSPVTVYFTLSGEATVSTDYTSDNNALTLSTVIINGTSMTVYSALVLPGSDTVDINIIAIADDDIEGLEDINIQLQGTDNDSFTIDNGTTLATLNIIDESTSTVSISAVDDSALEDGATNINPGLFRVSLGAVNNTSETIYVDYSVSGTATEGSDYESISDTVAINSGSQYGYININTLDDSLVEFSETVTLTLSDVSDSSGSLLTSNSGPFTISATLDSATVTILDDDAQPPVNNLPGEQVLDEGVTSLSFINGSTISVSDVNNDLASVQLQISGGTLSVEIPSSATSISLIGDSRDFTISGDQDDINAVLATLVFDAGSTFEDAAILTITSTDAIGLFAIDTLRISPYEQMNYSLEILESDHPKRAAHADVEGLAIRGYKPTDFDKGEGKGRKDLNGDYNDFGVSIKLSDEVIGGDGSKSKPFKINLKDGVSRSDIVRLFDVYREAGVEIVASGLSANDGGVGTIANANEVSAVYVKGSDSNSNEADFVAKVYKDGQVQHELHFDILSEDNFTSNKPFDTKKELGVDDKLDDEDAGISQKIEQPEIEKAPINLTTALSDFVVELKDIVVDARDKWFDSTTMDSAVRDSLIQANDKEEDLEEAMIANDNEDKIVYIDGSSNYGKDAEFIVHIHNEHAQEAYSNASVEEVQVTTVDQDDASLSQEKEQSDTEKAPLNLAERVSDFILKLKAKVFGANKDSGDKVIEMPVQHAADVNSNVDNTGLSHRYQLEQTKSELLRLFSSK
ncbi:Ig-like domain-containing protein, partial [Thiotrichales bacterium 19S9-12]|nr:Ig-like domain-containing protein [Thiotrichales bacterium 19S9-12]